MSRRSARAEAGEKKESLKREGSQKVEQGYTVATEGPYGRNVGAVELHGREATCKVPMAVKSLTTVTYV